MNREMEKKVEEIINDLDQIRDFSKIKVTI